jgi:LPXTG-motif cell wall-anchored protein
VSGAVDVVSALVGSPSDGVHVADVRIGHMEGAATVPAGGISCTIPITKVPDTDPVQAGHDFTYNITVHNTTDCVLNPAKVVDHLSGDEGVKFSILSEDPKASAVTNDSITWDNVGPIPAHGTKSLSITVHIPADSAAGKLTDDVALVDGKCANGGGSGITGVDTGVTSVSTVTGQTTVVAPTVTPATIVEGTKIPNSGPLPNTGGSPLVPLAGVGALTLAAVVRRRLRRT